MLPFEFLLIMTVSLFLVTNPGLDILVQGQGPTPPPIGEGPTPMLRPPLPSTSTLPIPQKPKPTEGSEALVHRWLDRSKLEANLLHLLRNSKQITLYSCDGKCGQTSREWVPDNRPKCFCDQQCINLKDCCFDYAKRCRPKQSVDVDITPRVCLFKRSDILPYGFVFINTCPPNTELSPISQRCTMYNKSDVMASIPVFDNNTRKAYRNVFCAACSNTRNVTMWRVKATCTNATFHKHGLSQLMKFIKMECTIGFSPPKALIDRHTVCLPLLHVQVYNTTDIDINTKTTRSLKQYCESYSFSVCAIAPDGRSYWFKNPHCILYNGILDLSDVTIECSVHRPTLPPLSIFFDFRSTTIYVSSTKRNTDVSVVEFARRPVTCSEERVYDPFTEQCRAMFNFQQLSRKASNNSNLFPYGTNCTFTIFNKTEYHLLDNGSLWIMARRRFYNNDSYFTINESIAVCDNLTQNDTILFSSSRIPSPPHMSPLQLLTIAGCGLSLVALLVLIFSYSVLPDMRNLPGKVVLSLASSMLVYHMLYFLINQSDVPRLCVVIAVCLHYSLLSSFCWMNVMAFDLQYTFTRKGYNMVSDTTTGCCSGLYLKYAVYAWLLPLIVVTVSLCLDSTDNYNIGYGSGEYCFINSDNAKLYVLVLPVGLILLYNFIALCHTMGHIKHERQIASKVSNQRRQPCLPIICLKMTTVMGVTWVLGYIASFQATAFIWYVFVLLNSLQGFLICVSYIMNKRIFSMYKDYFNRLKRRTNTIHRRSTNITPAPQTQQAI